MKREHVAKDGAVSDNVLSIVVVLSVFVCLSADPVVLVCGDVGTGKSTLCRFLLNYLLNR